MKAPRRLPSPTIPAQGVPLGHDDHSFVRTARDLVVLEGNVVEVRASIVVGDDPNDLFPEVVITLDVLGAWKDQPSQALHMRVLFTENGDASDAAPALQAGKNVVLLAARAGASWQLRALILGKKQQVAEPVRRVDVMPRAVRRRSTA